MDHRHHLSEVPEANYTGSGPVPESHLFLRSDSNNIPPNINVNHENAAQQLDPGLRLMDYPSSSATYVRAANSSIPIDMHLNSSSANGYNSFLSSQFTVGQGSSTDRTMNSQVDNKSHRFKRKNPANPMFFDSGNTHVHKRPNSSYQHSLCNSNSIVGSYRTDNLPAPVEGFQRNEGNQNSISHHSATRLISAYRPANVPVQASSSGNHFVGVGQKFMPVHQTSPWNSAGMVYNYRVDNNPANAEEFQRIIRHQNTNCHQVATSSTANYQPGILFDMSGLGSVNHDMNQSLMSSQIHRNLEANGGSSIIQNSNPSISFSCNGGHLTRGMNSSSHNRAQREAQTRTVASYPLINQAYNSLEEGVQSRTNNMASARHSCPINIGNNRARTSRSRSTCNRSQRFNHNICSRLPPGLVRISDSSFYDSIDLFDQHRDMRLDVDNMTYEDLLALEERIGSVSTGLSEEAISRCLIEAHYASKIQDDREKNCAICLEEYGDGVSLCSLKCNHYFHVSCIRKWLKIKNACPICKAAALSDAAKEKLVVSVT